METLTIVVSLVLLAFGVLQIILFFKLWGMTNDVRKMAKNVYLIERYAHRRNEQLNDSAK